MRTEQWSTMPMQAFTAEDGCPAFRATVQLDDSQIGQTFRWGVTVSTPSRTRASGAFPPRSATPTSTDRNRSFTLSAADQTERYYLTHCRRLGANKLLRDGAAGARGALRRMGAECAQRRAGARRAWPAGTSGTTGAASATLSRCIAARTACGRPTSPMPLLSPTSGVRPHAVHVPHHQGQRLGRLPHRPLLALPDRQRRGQSGAAIARGGAAAARIWTASRAAPWSSIRSGSSGRSGRSSSGPAGVAGDAMADRGGVLAGRVRSATGRCRPGSTTSSSTSCTSTASASAAIRAARWRTPWTCCAYLADLGVNAVELMPLAEYEGWASWGYGTSHYLADRIRRRRARPVQALHPGLPPARHRRDHRRRLQPLHPRRRARRMGVRFRRARNATSTTGTRAARPTIRTPIRPAAAATSTTCPPARRRASGRRRSARCSSPVPRRC